MKIRNLSLPAVAACLLALTSHAAKGGLDVLEPCHVRGVEKQILCGKHSVPENYAQPDKAKIDINIAVLPAVKKGMASDPLLILAGGPGQAATELAGLIDKIFSRVNTERDIILIDQRGTGESNPLKCEDKVLEEKSFELNDKEIDHSKVFQKCVDSYNVDLAQYSTQNAIKDFESVRKLLGYEQYNLYGGSYGTRAALVYMRMFPNSIRSSIIDSVAPTQVVIGPFGKFGSRAFEKVLEQCKNQPSCHKAFPQLKQDFLRLVQQLEAAPMRVNINHPRTHASTEFLVTDTKLVNTLRGALYSTTTHRLIPLVITELAKGNAKPLAGLMAMSGSGAPAMYTGLTFNILCSEDMPRATSKLLAEDANNDFIGGKHTQIFLDGCNVWPRYPVDDNFAKPVVSDIPTFILSGELDPVTPPAWGDLAAETLSNSRHFIVKYGAHTPIGSSCAPKLMKSFLEDLNLKAIDDSCLSDETSQLYLTNSNATGMGE